MPFYDYQDLKLYKYKLVLTKYFVSSIWKTLAMHINIHFNIILKECNILVYINSFPIATCYQYYNYSLNCVLHISLRMIPDHKLFQLDALGFQKHNIWYTYVLYPTCHLSTNTNKNDQRRFDVNSKIKTRIDKRRHDIMSYLKKIFKEMDISFQFLLPIVSI